MSRWRIVLLPLLLFVGLLDSCGSIPSKRVEELLVQKGFGKRAEGDAQVEDYAVVGSQVQFLVPTALLANPSYGDLLLLASQPQAVAVDGTVYVPGYGATYVLGMSGAEIGALVTEQLQAFYSADITVEARILASPKFFYVIGETLGPGPREFIGDLTVAEAFMLTPRTPLANIGKVRLIRPDPKNPLVVTINMRHILLDGISTYNINIKENDIIYVPPTFFGSVSRFIEKVTAPLTAAVSAIFAASNIYWQFRALGDGSPYGGFYGGGSWFF